MTPPSKTGLHPDLSTQLSRTGTLSRKSIKAPATPASATLGRPPRIPEPVLLPVVPDGKLSAASSVSSLASAGRAPLSLVSSSAEGVGGSPVWGPCMPTVGQKAHLTEPLSCSAVVTLYPYTRQKDNELSFSAGTVICITRRYSDGWCEGVSSEGTGFFPGNYVEPSC
ncbi:hypothetical protein HPG69_003010 [Diceros bicornis minor]|uniref:ABI gene family member 3 n=1 Tax=Diceros bicornis minor TaxID=77932 RepID=A0A7J7EJS3_DICBM|nr:hypothetical protein HPG69_003010 [Diceros bicornis minor]